MKKSIKYGAAVASAAAAALTMGGSAFATDGPVPETIVALGEGTCGVVTTTAESPITEAVSKVNAFKAQASVYNQSAECYAGEADELKTEITAYAAALEFASDDVDEIAEYAKVALGNTSYTVADFDSADTIKTKLMGELSVVPEGAEKSPWDLAKEANPFLNDDGILAAITVDADNTYGQDDVMAEYARADLANSIIKDAAVYNDKVAKKTEALEKAEQSTNAAKAIVDEKETDKNAAVENAEAAVTAAETAIDDAEEAGVDEEIVAEMRAALEAAKAGEDYDLSQIKEVTDFAKNAAAEAAADLKAATNAAKSAKNDYDTKNADLTTAQGVLNAKNTAKDTAETTLNEKKEAEATAKSTLDEKKAAKDAAMDAYEANQSSANLNAMKAAITAYNTAKTAYEDAVAATATAQEEYDAAVSAAEAAQAAYNTAAAEAEAAEAAYNTALENKTAAEKAKTLADAAKTLAEDARVAADKVYDAIDDAATASKTAALATAEYSAVSDAMNDTDEPTPADPTDPTDPVEDEEYDYSVIDGEGQVSTDGKAISFEFKADDTKLQEVYVNGTLLTRGEDYTVTKGSTIITLTPEYLATLGTGTYTLKAVWEDGEQSVDFKVMNATVDPTTDTKKGGKIKAPNTGAYTAEAGASASVAGLVGAIMTATLAGAAVVLRKRSA